MNTIEEYKTELQVLRDQIKELKEEYKIRIKNYNKSISRLEKDAQGGDQWLGSIFAYEKVIEELEELLK